MRHALDRMVKIYRNGTPCYVADWYGKLSPQGRRMIGSENIMAPYPASWRAHGLTQVEYTVPELRTKDGKVVNLPYRAPAAMLMAAE